MEDLPLEILLAIFEHFDEGGDVARVLTVHSRWAAAAEVEGLWEYFVLREFEIHSVSSSWYEFYKSRFLRFYYQSTIKKHNNTESCWIVIDGFVLDVTEFLQKRAHPGGVSVIYQAAGKDTTSLFQDVGHSLYAEQLASTLRIGRYKKENFDSSGGSEQMQILPLPKNVPIKERSWFILLQNASLIYITLKIVGLWYPDDWWPWGDFSIQTFILDYLFSNP